MEIKSSKKLLYPVSSVFIIFLVMSISCKDEPAIGIFDKCTNIGNPRIIGRAFYDATTGEYRLRGSGKNIWDKRDEFLFLSKKIEGDFILSARVRFIGEGVNPHRKIGIMVRDSLFDKSPHINGVVHGDGLTSLQYRRFEKENTDELKSTDIAPDIIQLERKGDTFIFSTATEGEPFTVVEIPFLKLEEEANVGLFICSHEKNIIEEAVFDNVRLIIPAPDDFIPYNDFIGSHIEILDLETGKRDIVLTSPKSLQAPNWSPDGEKLIYNCEGKIYSFEIDSAKSTEINTGFAVNNNNDHVLSFDGKLMGISDHTEHPEKQSLVYILPAEGGTPVLISPAAPSYLHGFSPDGEFLVYTAGRNNAEHLDIYRISLSTREEIRLTDAPGLDDGSEYSPCGEYIYFNSDRTGTMQIWRMKPDGSNQEQLTFDDYNDWFPHVSPDGKNLVFISYAPEIASNDHPFYKHVYIRTMPVDGGDVNVVAYVYGGQGSMNVFNWSPDGKRIAFVSNTVI
ncbi:MAG: PD40 domain-containing protein [Prolixibacteraceae bacterium]|nr:PD40 domain-containing protein [Prolixibacteraceae bacterium]